MKIEEAVKKAGANEHVQKLNGYFLGSCFASLTDEKKVKEWTLLYYSPQTNKVVDCFVNEKFVTVGEETPAIGEMKELDVGEVKIDINRTLALLGEKFKKKTINTLISLHMKDFSGKSMTVWTVGFVTQDISVTSFDVDASTGKILKEETTRLIKRL